MKAEQAQIFDLPFFTPEFREAWNEWLEYRKQRKLPKYVPVGLKATFSKLLKDSNNNEQKAIAIIQRAMAGNWQGLHPDKAEVVQMVPKNHHSITTNQFMKRIKPTEARPMTDEEMMEWIEGYRNKAEINVLFLSPDLYPFLERKGLLAFSRAEKNEFLLRAIPFRKIELAGDENKLLAFNIMVNAGILEGPDRDRVIEIAKKIAVAEYIKKSQQ